MSTFLKMHKLDIDHELAALFAPGDPDPSRSIFDLPIHEARAAFDSHVMPTDAAVWANSISSVEDKFVGKGEKAFKVRVYRPQHSQSSATLVFFHGGGFMLGGIEQMDEIARRLCRDVGAVVVSVDYRLAPEHPYPAALEDALISAQWVFDNAIWLGGDAEKVALVGESAGGNLAVSVALHFIGRPQKFCAQLLIAPGVDLSEAVSGVGCPTLSMKDMAHIRRNYLGDTKSACFPPSPSYAEAFTGLPPTVIGVARNDILLPSVLDFAELLQRDGIQVIQRTYPTLVHAFFGLAPFSQAAKAASDQLCLDLQFLINASENAVSQPVASPSGV